MIYRGKIWHLLRVEFCLRVRREPPAPANICDIITQFSLGCRLFMGHLYWSEPVLNKAVQAGFSSCQLMSWNWGTEGEKVMSCSILEDAWFFSLIMATWDMVIKSFWLPKGGQNIDRWHFRLNGLNVERRENNGIFRLILLSWFKRINLEALSSWNEGLPTWRRFPAFYRVRWGHSFFALWI